MLSTAESDFLTRAGGEGVAGSQAGIRKTDEGRGKIPAPHLLQGFGVSAQSKPAARRALSVVRRLLRSLAAFLRLRITLGGS